MLRIVIYIAEQTALRLNAHDSSNRDSRIIRQLGYKHILCQNVASTMTFASPYIFS